MYIYVCNNGCFPFSDASRYNIVLSCGIQWGTKNDTCVKLCHSMESARYEIVTDKLCTIYQDEVHHENYKKKKKRRVISPSGRILECRIGTGLDIPRRPVVMSPYCPVRHRESETLLTLRKLLTAARSTAVVYSTIRLPTNPTQITDAMNQRYFVQMAQWRLVHTNEDPFDRINRTPQHHE